MQRVGVQQQQTSIPRQIKVCCCGWDWSTAGPWLCISANGCCIWTLIAIQWPASWAVMMFKKLSICGRHPHSTLPAFLPLNSPPARHVGLAPVLWIKVFTISTGVVLVLQQPQVPWARSYFPTPPQNYRPYPVVRHRVFFLKEVWSLLHRWISSWLRSRASCGGVRTQQDPWES